MNKEIKTEIENSFNELIGALTALDQQEMNTIPFEGSWTAAQVGDHLLKSYGIMEMLRSNTAETERPVDEKVAGLKNLFMDFSTKMSSPDFILPETEPLNKETLIADLKDRTRRILEFIQENELNATCLGFILPNTGPMTRFEWISFVNFHTQRHNHQLKNIAELVRSKK